MQMTLNIETRRIAEVTIVTVRGVLVIDTWKILPECVEALVASGRRKILLNLEEVTRIDDSGLGSLVNVFTMIYRAGAEIRLMRPSQCVRDLFKSVRVVGYPSIESWSDVHSGEIEALASFAEKSK